MKSRVTFLAVSAIALIAWSARAQTPPAAAKDSATIIVPVGTRIPLVLENAISTRTARAGDPVYFETVYPLEVNGHIVIPAGSYMSGELLSAKRPGKVKGRGQITLKLSQLILSNGYTVNLEGTPTGAGTGGGEEMGKEGEVKGPTSRGNDATIIVSSTVGGAVIGGATAGQTGARAGLGAGAATGLMGVLLTRGPDAQLPRGTTMDILIDKPIPLLASQVQFKDPGKAPDVASPSNRQPSRHTIPF